MMIEIDILTPCCRTHNYESECPRCVGEGRVNVIAEGHQYEWEHCNECDGSGELPKGWFWCTDCGNFFEA